MFLSEKERQTELKEEGRPVREPKEGQDGGVLLGDMPSDTPDLEQKKLATWKCQQANTKKSHSLFSLANTQERADELDRKLVEKTCWTPDNTRGNVWSRSSNTWEP